MKDIVYDWGGFNSQLFYAINSLHSAAYDKFMMLGTILGKYYFFPICMVLIASFFCRQFRHKRISHAADYTEYRKRWIETFIVLSVGFLVELVLVEVLKEYLSLPRPFIALPSGTVTQLWTETPYSSFPSGHCYFAMLMAAGLWPMLWRTGKFLAVFYVAWVSLSRIALGVHFPADVIGSLAISLLAVLVIRKLLKYKR